MYFHKGGLPPTWNYVEKMLRAAMVCHLNPKLLIEQNETASPTLHLGPLLKLQLHLIWS